ncbi:MAG: DNA recombination/repair protein RecA, partial [Sulfurihydrogenibium sp.]|nr:DNA recombination/repair protein RecA [Sulfurihydrogenibium sp.]
MIEEEILEAKKKALETAIAKLEKKYGKGTLMTLSSEDIKSVEVIPTGSLSLDIATGIGGVPKGRIVEIYGIESSGKTTLTLHIIAEAQRRGGRAVFIDAEHAFDPKYAKAIGVNLDELIISQPDYGEQAIEIAETLVRSNAVDVIVIDSVAALVPKAEIEGDIEDSNVGLHARLMSKAMRVLKGAVNKS